MWLKQPLPLQVQAASNSAPSSGNGTSTANSGNNTVAMGNRGGDDEKNDTDDITSIDTKTVCPVEFENNKCEISEITLTEINCVRL